MSPMARSKSNRRGEGAWEKDDQGQRKAKGGRRGGGSRSQGVGSETSSQQTTDGSGLGSGQCCLPPLLPPSGPNNLRQRTLHVWMEGSPTNQLT